MPKKKTDGEFIENGKCGHVNKHSRSTQGELDGLACEKEKGHDGNHGAYHIQYIAAHNGLVVINKKHYTEEKVWCEWTPDAGVLASEIVPEISPPTAADLAKIQLIKSLAGGDLPTGTIVG